MTPSNPRKKKTSGIALHASTVALSPARAVTSHLRKRYRERYRGKYRFAPIVFTFDMFLLGILLGLVMLDLFWLLQASFISGPGLDLSLSAEPLRASDVMPVLARVRSTDGREHDDVMLRWRLPEWVEVIRAEPPIQRDGSIRIGRILPGGEWDSHLLVRIRAAKGTNVPFAFTLTQFDPLGLNRSVNGSEARVVESSALVTMPIPSFASTYASGSSLGVVVVNSGSSTIPVVTVHAGDASSALFGGQSSVPLGELKPGDTKFLFFDPVRATSTAYAWDVLDGAQISASGHADLRLNPGWFPIVVDSAVVNAAATGVRVTYHADTGSGITLKHLLFVDSLGNDSDYSTISNAGTVEFPLVAGVTAWRVVPFVDGKGGVDQFLGPLTEGIVHHIFPLRAEARYYSSSGDQLGVGPTPPKVGETTSYWIVWTAGPADDAYSNLVLSADLPDGVRATGKYASQINGTFKADGGHVIWSIPSLNLAGTETQTFAFEVSLTPSASMVGKSVTLVGPSSARAIETKSGIEFDAETSSDDTRLQHDQKAKGSGIVR